MGRLRSRLANTPRDREVQNLLVDAVRKAREAQRLCVQAAREGLPRGRRHAQTLQQAITLLESVGYLTPNVDLTDPDLTPEEQKRPNWFRRPESPAPEPQGEADGT